MIAVKHFVAKNAPAFVTVLVMGTVAGGLYGIKKMMDDKPVNPKKMVQQITIIAPPTPPPPEQKMEEPPPPPEEEQKIEEPEPVPEDLPDTAADEPPPGADLGIDAEGAAGNDGFGLEGRKGGRSLLAGGGNPYSWYSNVLQQDVLAKITERKNIRRSAYRITASIWVDASTAKIKRVELSNSTGDKKLDKELQLAIASVGIVSEKPPLELPQPIKLQINSRM